MNDAAKSFRNFPYCRGKAASDSYLYVVGHPDGPKKIGVSSKPRTRLSNLRTSSPVPLDGEFLAACDAAVAKAIETRAHRILASARQNGEWFSVSLAEAISAVMQSASDLGHPLRRIMFGKPFGKKRLSPTPSQIRAARALLGWKQATLAEKAEISPTGLNNIELGKADPKTSTLNAIRSALEEAGVEFLPNDGVRRKPADA